MRPVLVVVALSVAALTACGVTDGNTGGTTMTTAAVDDVEANLRARPSFEVAQQQYRTAVHGWATRIASIASD